MDSPRGVTEVASDLTQDGRDGEGGERRTVLRIEAFHRLHKTELGDLHEVVVRLTPVGEPA